MRGRNAVEGMAGTWSVWGSGKTMKHKRGDRERRREAEAERRHGILDEALSRVSCELPAIGVFLLTWS